MNRICIIGTGIHGMTSAIALAEAGFKVYVIDKNEDILQGTSGSTHNRAHVGYHYPRSIETAKECYEGLQYFKLKYPEALSYPKDVYYLIAKNSKTTVNSFKQFCDDLSYPYEITLPSNEFLIKDNIENGFKVEEPVFNLFKLKEIFKKTAKEKNIEVYASTHFSYFDIKNNEYEVTCNRLGDVTKIYVDYIINATYAYSNNILKILDLEEDITEYVLQYTEVAILKTKKYVPSLTVMDGPYVSLMPYANLEPNLYLLYDVINSVVEKEIGYYFKEKKIESNVKNMIKHCSSFFPFELEYVSSLYGSRPIPTNLLENKGDCRKTRIKCHKKYPRIYSILEGKFISAPLVAQNIVSLIQHNV
jgi:hypothetical protein